MDGQLPRDGASGAPAAQPLGAESSALHKALAAQARAQGDVLVEVDGHNHLTGWASDGIAEVAIGPITAGLGLEDAFPAPLAAACRAVLAGHSVPATFDNRPDGEEWFQITEIPIEGLTSRLLSFRNCSALMEEQARVGRRDALLKDLFDLSPVGVLLLNYKTAQVLEANETLLRLGGWAREDIVGLPVDALLSADVTGDIDLAVADMKAKGQFGPIEKLFRRPDGSLFETIVKGLKVGLPGNRRVWVLVEDVSQIRAHMAELRLARDQALRSRAELQVAVEALPHGFVMFDAEDRIVLTNSQMRMIYPELTEQMLVGRSYEEVMRYGLRAGAFPAAIGREEAYAKAILAARKDAYFEGLGQTSQGRTLRLIERRMPDGGRVGLRIDVTQELEVQEHLTQVIEGAQVGTWEWDLRTHVMQINERWAAMLGYRLEELVPLDGHRIMTLMHPEDVPKIRKIMAAILGKQQDFVDHVFRMRHAEGHWVWIETRGKVSRIAPDGGLLTMSGVHIDVTAMKDVELRLAGIIRGAEAGTWEFDLRSNLNRINERWAEMLGYTRAELEPLTVDRWQSMLHPDDLAHILATEKQAFLEKSWSYAYELRLRHKLGHWMWIQSRGQVTEWDANGHPVAMSGVHLDISERKRLEGALEEERDFLSTMMETSVSGIMAVDAEARIIFMNREIQSIFEVPNDLLLGQICDPLALRISDHAGQSMTLAQMPCRLAQTSGTTLRDVRLRIGMADGREKVVSVNAAPLPDPNGLARVVCTITDITTAAEAEDRLRDATLRAEAANQAKSQFLANVSHELRTPLNGILGMADLMAHPQPGDDPTDMLRTIRESGAHLLSIVNDILDLAKIESGKLTLDCGPVALPDLAARVDAMHRVPAKAKGVRLWVQLDEALCAPRLGDAKRVLQVLHNLVGNAIKFTRQGEVSLTFSSQGQGGIKITVADTGIGMTAEQSANVWEEFTQADGSITRRFGGTGLGLPIVRRLVALMGGEITLDSTAGVGTKVIVTLPLSALEQSLVSSEPVPREPPDARKQLAGLRALVAEDNATNRMILGAMLSRLGIEAVMVEDGDEVAGVWGPGAFDVVLLDISMPRKDGISALQDLQDLARHLGAELPPAIAVTANAMTHHVDAYHQAGFAAVISKPVRLGALADVIGQLCKPQNTP
ncbi:MAG: PAS domain S-box protein [Rhodobacteraceae bacterium]|nr:PAS domain S-box protein [Paracoccaceae bacterium]